MDGCVYRTKDGECELWENDRNHKPFCDMEHCDNIAPTNADRIRAMTDEELADWLNAVLTSNVAPYAIVRGANKRGKLLDWLRQEVQDGT